MMNPATAEEFGEYKTNVILNTLSEGICQIGLDGVITYSNHSACELLERTSGEMEGHYPEIFFGRGKGEGLPDDFWCPIRFVLESGEISHVTSDNFVKSNGAEVIVEYICVPLLENGEISGAVISFQDVEERYEVNRALERARDLAVQAAETKAAFLANMSHEIRTPLNGIIGTVDLLSESALDIDQKGYLDMLQSSIKLLRIIVDDILDFSKIEAGAVRLEKLEFSPVEIAAETMKFFSSTLGNKRLDLSVDVEKSVAKILVGDSSRLRQILNNLVNNSIKFTECGFVTLRLRTVSETETIQRVRFEVSDSGIGISENVIANLFRPFNQADASTTRLYGGTGLGLAICRQLVEMMGGNIGCVSVEGEGSTFWLEIPFEKSLEKVNFFAAEQPKVIEKQEIIEEIPTFAKGLRVLIVEDNEINQVITERILASMGLEVSLAASGAEAIELVSEKEFDCIFMDCQMPEMDGFETTRIIREMKGEDIKIFALSASTSDIEKKKAFEAGMEEYVPKPFTKNDLALTLTRYFDSNQGKDIEISENNVQHSLANIIESTRLESFRQIEEGGKKNFTIDILKLFFEHSESLITEMNSNLSEKKIKKALEKAHSLKGSAGNVGLMKLYSLFESLEEAIRQDPENDLSQILHAIREEFEKTKKLVIIS